MRRALLASLLVVLCTTTVADARGVSLRAAQRYAHRTYVNDPTLGRRTFDARYRRTVRASDGSTITAAEATLHDSGDGSGQIVLLFRGTRFLGWASAFDTLHLALSASGSSIVVRYGVYRGRDPFCCPSSTKRVVYRYRGGRIVASGAPPRIFGRRGNRLHLAGS